jgi:hypothetical protein
MSLHELLLYWQRSWEQHNCRMASSGMLRRVALVRTDVSEELSASIIRTTRIGELGYLAITSNRCSVRRRNAISELLFQIRIIYYIHFSCF